MAVFDRVKGAFQALARGADATIDYKAYYRAKVLKQNANGNRLDVQPEDPRLPPMTNIPLLVGVPGLEVHLLPGHQVLIGWTTPDHPFAMMWEAGTAGTTPISLTLHAKAIQLGGPNLTPLDGVVRAQTPCQFTGAPHLVGGKTSLVVLAKET